MDQNIKLENLGKVGDNDQEARAKLLNEAQLLMGSGKIQVELDKPHWDLAYDRALGRYRQRSSNSTEKSFMFLELQPEVQTYTLPNEVTEVIKLYRRGVGGTTTGGGSYLDPFALQYNNLYLLQAGGQGGLATFHFYHDYQETIRRLMGGEIAYVWNSNTKRLTIERRFLAPETILIETENYVPDHILVNDYKTRNWLRDYIVATAKQILGDIRSKFASLPGPLGGVQLNGEALKQEAQQEYERLEMEIQTFVDTNVGMPFIIG